MKTVKTNIGKCVFLFNKHFPLKHKGDKIFDRNTLKLSCSCIPNLKKPNKQINSHNQNIIKDQPQNTPKTCNCLTKDNCPMNGLSFKKSVVLHYSHLR